MRAWYIIILIYSRGTQELLSDTSHNCWVKYCIEIFTVERRKDEMNECEEYDVINRYHGHDSQITAREQESESSSSTALSASWSIMILI